MMLLKPAAMKAVPMAMMTPNTVAMRPKRT